MKQKVHRYVSNDFSLRASVVDATQVVKKMAEIQNTMPLPTVAVGRAMVGVLLMAAHAKEGHKVGALFKGEGPLASIYAEAQFTGEVRGYASNPEFHPQDYAKGLSLKSSFGPGFLTVFRYLPYQKQPHQGTVQLIHGEVGEDLAHYLKQSQQISSIISLGVYLGVNAQVESAGGLLIEVMPGVEDEVIDKLAKNAKAVTGAISEKILKGASEEDLISPYLLGIPYTRLDHDYEVKYVCPCSKERVLRSFQILGIGELTDMIEKNENPAVSCQMCGQKYHVTTSEIIELRNYLQKESMH